MIFQLLERDDILFWSRHYLCSFNGAYWIFSRWEEEREKRAPLNKESRKSSVTSQRPSQAAWVRNDTAVSNKIGFLKWGDGHLVPSVLFVLFNPYDRIKPIKKKKKNLNNSMTADPSFRLTLPIPKVENGYSKGKYELPNTDPVSFCQVR